MKNQMPGWKEMKKGSGEVYNRMYFRYNSYDEVLRLYCKSKILSGFTVKENTEQVFVAFGRKGRGKKHRM